MQTIHIYILIEDLRSQVVVFRTLNRFLNNANYIQMSCSIDTLCGHVVVSSPENDSISMKQPQSFEIDLVVCDCDI